MQSQEQDMPEPWLIYYVVGPPPRGNQLKGYLPADAEAELVIEYEKDDTFQTAVDRRRDEISDQEQNILVSHNGTIAAYITRGALTKAVMDTTNSYYTFSLPLPEQLQPNKRAKTMNEIAIDQLFEEITRGRRENEEEGIEIDESVREQERKNKEIAESIKFNTAVREHEDNVLLRQKAGKRRGSVKNPSWNVLMYPPGVTPAAARDYDTRVLAKLKRRMVVMDTKLKLILGRLPPVEQEVPADAVFIKEEDAEKPPVVFGTQLGEARAIAQIVEADAAVDNTSPAQSAVEEGAVFDNTPTAQPAVETARDTTTPVVEEEEEEAGDSTTPEQLETPAPLDEFLARLMKSLVDEKDFAWLGPLARMWWDRPAGGKYFAYRERPYLLFLFCRAAEGLLDELTVQISWDGFDRSDYPSQMIVIDKELTSVLRGERPIPTRGLETKIVVKKNQKRAVLFVFFSSVRRCCLVYF
jgi:hypothetical protein